MENQTVINGFSLNPITNDAFVPESNVSGTAREEIDKLEKRQSFLQIR